MNGLDLAKKVSCKTPYIFNSETDKKYKIAAFDFGIKTMPNFTNLFLFIQISDAIRGPMSKHRFIQKFHVDRLYVYRCLGT